MARTWQCSNHVTHLLKIDCFTAYQSSNILSYLFIISVKLKKMSKRNQLKGVREELDWFGMTNLNMKINT